MDPCGCYTEPDTGATIPCPHHEDMTLVERQAEQAAVMVDGTVYGWPINGRTELAAALARHDAQQLAEQTARQRWDAEVEALANRFEAVA